MSEITLSELQFLELYKSGIWNRKPDSAFPFSDNVIDWDSIFQLAEQQTVSGILTDGMILLPKEHQPSRASYMSAVVNTSNIEDDNKKMNALLPKLFNLMHGGGVKPWLLKGQGVALNYVHPLHRQNGDVDIYFPDILDYGRASRYFQAHIRDNYICDEKNMHDEFEIDGIAIELHGHIDGMINHTTHKNIGTWIHNTTKRYPARTWHTETGVIVIPPVNFDALFIFIHLARHYFSSCVGLRQITDWMLYLNNVWEEIDIQQLLNDINFLGLKKIWSVFSTMAVDWLGYPKEKALLYNENYSSKARQILRFILDSGNFGYHDERIKSESDNFLINRGTAFKGHLQMILRNFCIFPEESLFCIPSFIKDGIQSASERAK